MCHQEALSGPGVWRAGFFDGATLLPLGCLFKQLLVLPEWTLA